MNHRHVQTRNELRSVAIDDIIDRGGLVDWLDLRDKTESDPDVAQKVLRVCEAHCADPYAQRYHFWRHYARKVLA